MGSQVELLAAAPRAVRDTGSTRFVIPTLLVVGGVVAVTWGVVAPRRDEYLAGVCLLAAGTGMLLAALSSRTRLAAFSAAIALAVLVAGVAAPGVMLRLYLRGDSRVVYGLAEDRFHTITTPSGVLLLGMASIAKVDGRGRIVFQLSDDATDTFVGQDGSFVRRQDKQLVAYGPHGDVRWRRETSAGVLAMDDGIVVIGGLTERDVVAVAADGSLAWTKPAGDLKPYSTNERTSLDTDTVIMPSMFWGWLHDDQQAVYSVHGALVAQLQIVLWAFDDTVVGVAGVSTIVGWRGGAEVWRRTVDTGVRSLGFEGRRFTLGYAGGVPSVAIDMVDGSVAQLPREGYLDGDTYVVQDQTNGTLSGYSAETGKTIWTRPGAGTGGGVVVEAGAVVTQGPLDARLSTLTGRGVVNVVTVRDSATGRITARTMNSPQWIIGVGPGRALLRTRTQDVLVGGG